MNSYSVVGGRDIAYCILYVNLMITVWTAEWYNVTNCSFFMILSYLNCTDERRGQLGGVRYKKQ